MWKYHYLQNIFTNLEHCFTVYSISILPELKITSFQSPLACMHYAGVKARSPSVAPVFTALHVMQTRYSEENSVCLSVCPSVRPSVTRVDCDKTVERFVQIYIPYERTFSLVF